MIEKGTSWLKFLRAAAALTPLILRLRKHSLASVGDLIPSSRYHFEGFFIFRSSGG